MIKPVEGVLRYGLRSIKPILRRVEARRLSIPADPVAPATFIIGVPRSGTTLLYQLMTQCFRVSYICNFADRHRDFPVTATRLMRPWIRRHGSDYGSDHGQTAGHAGPSEGHQVFGRWFALGYLDETGVTEAAVREARSTIAGIERVLGHPFVNKMPENSTRIRALDRSFPGCIFLRVRRSPIQVAQSLLKRRRERAPLHPVEGDRHWWSVQPKEYAQIRDRDAIDQVAEQVYYIERNMDSDLDRIGVERCHDVEYAALCADPRAILAGVVAFLARSGIRLDWRSPPPDRFPASTRSFLAGAELARLEAKLEALFGPTRDTG